MIRYTPVEVFAPCMYSRAGPAPVLERLAALGGGAPPMFDSAYLVQVFGALLLVFGCLFGLVFLLRRFNNLPVSDRKSIKVLGAVKKWEQGKAFTAGSRGWAAAAAGVAAGSVRTLYVFDQPLDDVTAVHSGARGDFALLKTHATGKTTS